ncbi:hypothetical protein K438DRAFT_357814 [Mycena galopus ATCC 62051]|nr:hypothetical protein K438DRAFT_357814 [Mycena galopus ATCC 62051]
MCRGRGRCGVSSAEFCCVSSIIYIPVPLLLFPRPCPPMPTLPPTPTPTPHRPRLALAHLPAPRASSSSPACKPASASTSRRCPAPARTQRSALVAEWRQHGPDGHAAHAGGLAREECPAVGSVRAPTFAPTATSSSSTTTTAAASDGLRPRLHFHLQTPGLRYSPAMALDLDALAVDPDLDAPSSFSPSLVRGRPRRDERWAPYRWRARLCPRHEGRERGRASPKAGETYNVICCLIRLVRHITVIGVM